MMLRYSKIKILFCLWPFLFFFKNSFSFAAEAAPTCVCELSSVQLEGLKKLRIELDLFEEFTESKKGYVKLYLEDRKEDKGSAKKGILESLLGDIQLINAIRSYLIVATKEQSQESYLKLISKVVFTRLGYLAERERIISTGVIIIPSNMEIMRTVSPHLLRDSISTKSKKHNELVMINTVDRYESLSRMAILLVSHMGEPIFSVKKEDSDLYGFLKSSRSLHSQFITGDCASIPVLDEVGGYAFWLYYMGMSKKDAEKTSFFIEFQKSLKGKLNKTGRPIIPLPKSEEYFEFLRQKRNIESYFISRDPDWTVKRNQLDSELMKGLAKIGAGISLLLPSRTLGVNRSSAIQYTTSGEEPMSLFFYPPLQYPEERIFQVTLYQIALAKLEPGALRTELLEKLLELIDELGLEELPLKKDYRSEFKTICETKAVLRNLEVSSLDSWIPQEQNLSQDLRGGGAAKTDVMETADTVKSKEVKREALRSVNLSQKNASKKPIEEKEERSFFNRRVEDTILKIFSKSERGQIYWDDFESVARSIGYQIINTRGGSHCTIKDAQGKTLGGTFKPHGGTVEFTPKALVNIRDLLRADFNIEEFLKIKCL